LKIRFLTKLTGNDVYLKSLISLGALVLVSAVIWVGGPFFAWKGYFPLAQADKRLYLILFFFLVALLKFLIWDLATPDPLQHADARMRKKLQSLQNRFQGALQFLKKTTVTKQGKLSSLNDLPWYLLIGPSTGGKTSLLLNSKVNFILQRQFQGSDRQIEASENCDWWITRDASIIDVPGKYLSAWSATDNPAKPPYPILWKLFLRLIKKFRGKNGLNGILITLPLPEIMRQNDAKKYHLLLRDLFQRLYELKKIFSQPIPCQVIITKCDLLSGFSEFFSESADDEITQAWGVTLSPPKNGEKIHEQFAQRFNGLIKKLNQQLLWRLHQERNPMARPYIKDFPLQVERLKEFTIDFIKKFDATHLAFSLQGVYLTSSLQTKSEPEINVLDESSNTTQRAVQIFREPLPVSRAYFIKQFLSYGIAPNQRATHTPSAPALPAWKRYGTIAAAVTIITGAAWIMGKDFEQGIKQTYAIQNELSDYRLTIQQFHNPDEHLAQTLKLLDSLHQSAKQIEFKLDLAHLFSFYSQKSQLKAGVTYRQALQTILLPEIKNYLQEYLKNPVNKNIDKIYAVLKAYLMLGDTSHLEAEYVLETLQKILPKSMSEAESSRLIDHATLALHSSPRAVPLDPASVDQTRKFLTGMPSPKLGYIILKNINANTIESEITLGNSPETNPIFVTQQINNPIPLMFTAKVFSNIFSREINLAAEEAVTGNWVLGTISATRDPESISTLADQLRTAYVASYIETWENQLANIDLASPKDLMQVDSVIMNLVSNNSPLLQLLQTVYENTYFEPIISSSQKLQNLGLLLDKSKQTNNLLYEIFSSLQSLHQYVQSVLKADDKKKAAFVIISNRVKNLGTPDAITQLRVVAMKSPEPIKTWLEKISNDTWHLLMQEATRYLDISWQEKVMRAYQAEIANRYPFNMNTEREVELKKFASFFGNPGIVLDFYAHYLQPLIDTSTPDWRWKTTDNGKLPFSDETLRQIQQAVRIHRTFFPNGDNKLLVQFGLQPYKFDKQIKNVKLSISDKQIIDEGTKSKAPHIITWPSHNKLKTTSVQLTLQNQKVIQRNFPGDWGWFKLINQSFESAASRKQMLINLSSNEQSAEYLLFTEGQFNPFLSLNLRHFRLPQRLTEQK